MVAKTNNSKGMSSVAGGYGSAGVRSIPVVVGGQSPNSSLIPYGIIYAVNRGAKIINLSLSVDQSASIDSALSYAASHPLCLY